MTHRGPFQPLPFCDSAGGTLQPADRVLGPLLRSREPYGPFIVDQEVKVGWSLPPSPANPALVGAFTHCWEGAGSASGGSTGIRSWRFGVLHPQSPK